MATVLSFSSECYTDRIEELKRIGYGAVDKMLNRLKDKIQGQDLESLSDLLRDEGRSITGELLEAIVQDSRPELYWTECACEKCGRNLKKKRDAQRDIETQHGVIRIERPYFYCRHCQHGFSPYDSALGLAPQRKQYDLQKGAARLLTELPYETASELFKDVTGLDISDHCMHEESERLGQVTEISDALPGRDKVEALIDEVSNGRVWRPVLVVAADGAHLPTRPEVASREGKRGPGSWQEAKGFRMYLVGQDRIEQLMSWHQISNEKEFGEALKFASTLIPKERVRIGLIGDGAPWIWTHMKSAFPQGREILDYFHCSEHIHKLAEVQYPEDKDQQALWIESTMARINYGEVEAVVWGLQRMTPTSNEAEEEIRKLIGYLRRNSKRIQYDSAKRGQYPRGSGGIESANKFICHVRMKRSGAWWYKVNGNHMLKLRCAKANGTFDEIFEKYKRLQRSGKIETNG